MGEESKENEDLGEECEERRIKKYFILFNQTFKNIHQPNKRKYVLTIFHENILHEKIFFLRTKHILSFSLLTN